MPVNPEAGMTGIGTNPAAEPAKGRKPGTETLAAEIVLDSGSRLAVAAPG